MDFERGIFKGCLYRIRMLYPGIYYHFKILSNQPITIIHGLKCSDRQFSLLVGISKQEDALAASAPSDYFWYNAPGLYKKGYNRCCESGEIERILTQELLFNHQHQAIISLGTLLCMLNLLGLCHNCLVHKWSYPAWKNAVFHRFKHKMKHNVNSPW